MILWIFLLLPLWNPVGAETPPKTLTLADCYALALQQSETIAIKREQLAETEARFQQAFSNILPRLDFVSTDKKQDSNGTGGQFTLTYIPERKFSMSQPLFSGFKEFAAMSGAKAEKQQRVFERIRAEHLLLTDVADAFYLLFEQREDLKVLKTIREALLKRIQDLKQREEIGRSRPSEVTAAQAQLERVEADIELIKGQEVTARELLEFLTGTPIDQISEAMAGLPNLPPESNYVNKAGTRPDVRAAEEAVHASEKQITYAKGDYWPNASLQGNYYTQRAGVLQGIDWDALLLIDVPLFQGGATKGKVRESKAKLNEARLQRRQLERAAVQEIRDAYARVQSAINRTFPLEKALKAAEKSHESQVRDYRHNLVNNLEVLSSLQNLRDVKRDFIRAGFEVKRLYWRLRTAAGETL